MTTELATIQPQFSFSELVQIAKCLAASRLFGIQTEDQAIALCLIAQAEGKHPATAALVYNIIQGRPALNADSMLARHQATGGKVQWTCYTPERVTGVFSHPQGGEIEITWDTARAQTAGLVGKDNWRKWPQQMRRARCISEGVRTVNPGCLVGLYAPEEVIDFDPVRNQQVTPSQVIEQAERDTDAYYQQPTVIRLANEPATEDPRGEPTWQDIWPLEQHGVELAVSGIKLDDDNATYWYNCTREGVTAWAYYQPSTDGSKAAAEQNISTKRLTARISGGHKHPKLSHVKFIDVPELDTTKEAGNES